MASMMTLPAAGPSARIRGKGNGGISMSECSILDYLISYYSVVYYSIV